MDTTNHHQQVPGPEQRNRLAEARTGWRGTCSTAAAAASAVAAGAAPPSPSCWWSFCTSDRTCGTRKAALNGGGNDSERAVKGQRKGSERAVKGQRKGSERQRSGSGCAPKRTVLAMFAHRRRFFLECCRAVAAHLRKWARHRRAAAGWYAYPALAPGGMGPTSRAVNRTETTISPCATPRLCQHQIRLSDPVIRSGYQHTAAGIGPHGQRTDREQRPDSDRTVTDQGPPRPGTHPSPSA